jgi:hypothetical protein
MERGDLGYLGGDVGGRNFIKQQNIYVDVFDFYVHHTFESRRELLS